MSVDLKRIYQRVRKNRPEFFVAKEIKESTMDGDGKVNVTIRKDVRAAPMNGARRHALSLSQKRF